MPVTDFGLVRTLHLLSAAIALGGFFVLPFLRPQLEGAEDSRLTMAGLSFIRTVEHWVIAPAGGALLVFGLLMVEGPVARFSFTDPGMGWLHIGTTLWLAVAGAVVGMVYSRRKLEAFAERGTTGGRAVAKVWGWWTTSAMIGALVIAAGIAVMAMRIGG